MVDLSEPVDVLVAGGGNAGLCAALTARAAGARVLVLEAAPRSHRGGNSRHTRNLRCMHDAPTEVLTERLLRGRSTWTICSGSPAGETDEALARLDDSRLRRPARDWMQAQGVRFQPALSGTLQLGRTNAFFLGGGKALLNAYYRTAERARRRGALRRRGRRRSRCEDGRFHARVAIGGATDEVSARALVAAAGGFEANLDWLERVLGRGGRQLPDPRHALQSGAACCAALLTQGAEPIGDPRQCHAVAIDARAPKFDGGIVTRVDCVSLGIVVNRDGRRFYDEGEDFWPKRYAIWGRLVAQQPEQIAYSIIDAEGDRRASCRRSSRRSRPSRSASSRASSSSIPTLWRRRSASFNAAVRPGSFDHTRLDDCRTEGLEPPKSHWARPLDTPPFYAYPLRPGITFTYLGVARGRARAGADGGRPAGRERVRRRRDHGRQHARPGLSRRLRHDDRHRVRPHRRRGGGAPCPAT